MKYIDFLNQSAEETAKQNNQLIAEEAELTLQHLLFTVKKELASKTANINMLKQQKSLNFDAIIKASNDKELLERKQKQLLELQRELF